MVDQSCVITVYRCGGVVERGQQVSPDVSDFRGVLFQAVYDIPDMLPVDFKQAVLYDFPWVVLAAYAYHALGTANRVHHDVQNVIQQVGIVPKLLPQDVIFDIFFYDFSVCFHRIHLISRRRRSIFRQPSDRIDRWISLIQISIIYLSIIRGRFLEVLTSGLRNFRLPFFGSQDFRFPNEVLHIDFRGLSLTLLLALDQPTFIQFAKQRNSFRMPAA